MCANMWWDCPRKHPSSLALSPWSPSVSCFYSGNLNAFSQKILLQVMYCDFPAAVSSKIQMEDVTVVSTTLVTNAIRYTGVMKHSRQKLRQTYWSGRTWRRQGNCWEKRCKVCCIVCSMSFIQVSEVCERSPYPMRSGQTRIFFRLKNFV